MIQASVDRLEQADIFDVDDVVWIFWDGEVRVDSPVGSTSGIRLLESATRADFLVEELLARLLVFSSHDS